MSDGEVTAQWGRQLRGQSALDQQSRYHSPVVDSTPPLGKDKRYKRQLLFFKFTCLGSKGDCQLLCTLTVVVLSYSALVKLELDADLCFTPVF